MKFPLLSFANEPIPRLANGDVRSSVQLLADTLQESCSVPNNIDLAYVNISPCVKCCRDKSIISLSAYIIRDVNTKWWWWGTLQNAIYHRLYAVDAPSLYCTSFITADGILNKRRNGHLLHLAVHYYFNIFVRPRGTARICKENYLQVLTILWNFENMHEINS
jgi:hypothetical protein